MTTPDAATEALAEAKEFVRSCMRIFSQAFTEKQIDALARKVLAARGYVIRKARKSG